MLPCTAWTTAVPTGRCRPSLGAGQPPQPADRSTSPTMTSSGTTESSTCSWAATSTCNCWTPRGDPPAPVRCRRTTGRASPDAARRWPAGFLQRDHVDRMHAPGIEWAYAPESNGLDSTHIMSNIATLAKLGLGLLLSRRCGCSCGPCAGAPRASPYEAFRRSLLEALFELEEDEATHSANGTP